MRAAVICLMNAIRANRHVRKLRASPVLARAAAGYARAMLAGGFFAHDAPGGPSFFDRMLRSGYLSRYAGWRVGENLGRGWGSGGTPLAMTIAWMLSPAHRRNIVAGDYRDVGVAVDGGSGQVAMYVVDFGGYKR
jgi:uncharacterized protein YkwD